MNWTDTKIEQLKELWKQNTLTHEIAKQLGTTKNSVIGKARRINLEQRRRSNSFRIKQFKQPRATSNPKGIPLRTIEELKNPKTIEDVADENSCRYPLGERNDPPKYFCGRDRNKNYPYCKPHVELCTNTKELDLNNKP